MTSMNANGELVERQITLNKNWGDRRAGFRDMPRNLIHSTIAPLVWNYTRAAGRIRVTFFANREPRLEASEPT